MDHTMTPTRISKPTRCLTWLLAAVFILASMPAPLFAQEMMPVPEAAAPAPEAAPAPAPEAPPAQDSAVPAPESVAVSAAEAAPAPETVVPAPEAPAMPAPEAMPPPESSSVPPPAESPAADLSATTPVQSSPAEAARERIQRLRAARAAADATIATSAEAPATDAFPGGPAEESSPAADGEVYSLNMKDAQLDVLLDRYSELTGRTMIKSPGINATFTFKAQQKLTRAEMIQAMDSLLTMNNLSLVPLGSRFFRVVQTDKAPSDGLVIQKGTPEGGHPESDALVSQLVGLKYMEMEDAVNIVQAMLHGFGKVQRFDRINSLLITETSSNLKRIYDILDLVDQPTETRIETRVYEIQHAKAADIAARLNELVSESQGEKKEEVAQVAQPNAPVRRPASMIRARQPTPAEAASPVVDAAAALENAMAERGIVQGKVKILADERTNIIIVISRPSNFVFFDKIVQVLDRSVDPEVIVQVLALEFADAEEMAGLLNDFIGAAKSESDSATPKTGDDAATTDTRAKALEDMVRQRAAAADRVRQVAGAAAVSKIGQLSPNTKILADKRTNTLMLMGTKGDIAALQEIVNKVDIMLAQVLIETVILEVNLNNTTAYGVNWLQKSMTAYSQTQAGPNGGVSVRQPVASWGGNFGNNDFATVAGDTVTRAFGGATGLNYFFTFVDLNMDMVLKMVASSGEGRVLATPVILTTDNTEASIMSGQQIPIRTGDVDSGGTTTSNYEYKDVGIQLKVKPRINPSRYVTLEITQTADTLGEPVDIGNGDTGTSINKREMTAMISVPSRSTIVLGGLVQTDYQHLNSHIPILGNIPLLGALFRNEAKTRKRTELLVLITPYVLMTPDEARVETARLHQASNVAAEDWYRGWSDSSLAPFSPDKLREMKRDEKMGRNRAQLKTGAQAVPEPTAPPVALIEPESAMPKPAPNAKDPEVFGREIERAMSGQADLAAPPGTEPAVSPAEAAGPLPAPEEPTTTAPYVFDPALSAAPAAPPAATPPPPERKPRRAIWGSKAKPEEPRSAISPAPANENGGTP
jgi:general secretion pathway protein D